MRELGRMLYKKEKECHSFFFHERVKGNGTDRETARELEGAGTREAEIEDESLRLCHYDKQQEHSSA